MQGWKTGDALGSAQTYQDRDLRAKAQGAEK